MNLSYQKPEIPEGPKSIKKGEPVKNILSEKSNSYLARNIQLVHPEFDSESFVKDSSKELEELSIVERGKYISKSLHKFLPSKYEDAIHILLKSLTPPNEDTEGLGLSVFFYLPHNCFIAEFGLDPTFNDGSDPFETSMQAQQEITKRFSCEFAIRPFLIKQQIRTLKVLGKWIEDPDPHVRRLCSEGTRPKLPWAQRIQSFIKDPSPALPILEALKNDPSLYVRRSVANHLGDITKDHPEIVFEICARWLKEADKELKWVIRHALRYPAKKGNQKALKLRAAAK